MLTGHSDSYLYFLKTYTTSRRQGRGNRDSLLRAPSVSGPPNSAELVQILAVSY